MKNVVLLASLILAITTMPLHSTEIIGHRGDPYDAPENTLTSFRLGWSQTEQCELDIWPTADGKLLVCHDKNTKRTTGVDKEIPMETLASLQQLDAGSSKAPSFAGEKLPSLREVMEALPVEKSLLIEIKSDRNVVPELKAEMEASGKLPQLAIHSFDYSACVAAKKALPSTNVAYLASLKLDSKTGGYTPALSTLIQMAKKGNLDGISLERSPVIDSAFVKQIHDAGLKINVWTVDDPSEARRLRDCGIDGIITNRPGWIKEQLAR